MMMMMVVMMMMMMMPLYAETSHGVWVLGNPCTCMVYCGMSVSCQYERIGTQLLCWT
jgi:hypothetical protein